MPFGNILGKFGKGAAGAVEGTAGAVEGAAGKSFLSQVPGGLSGTISSLGSIYILSQLLDTGADIGTELLTGRTKKTLELAKQQMENERKAKAALLEFQKQLYGSDLNRKNIQSMIGIGREGLANKLSILSQPDNVSKGAYDVATTQPFSAGEDVLYPLMFSLNQRQQNGQGISPLMALGLAI